MTSERSSIRDLGLRIRGLGLDCRVGVRANFRIRVSSRVRVWVRFMNINDAGTFGSL